jgi:excisionase family DNA binding protein
MLRVGAVLSHEGETMSMDKKFMNVDEVAACLNVSSATIYFWAETGKIPHSKLGKLIRFNPDVVASWVNGKSRGADVQETGKN